MSENAVLSVSERFGKLNGLTSFTVNIKRATGEVESLRYSLENIGNKQNPLYVFRNSGAELNNSGAVKQIKAVENAFASFTQKIEQFKSTNNGKLSGLTQPLADFESKLAGLKSGTYTIDEVKNAFKLLQAEVSKIDAPLKATIDKFSATKTAVDNGKKSISDYREALKGLNNVPKELSQELSNASKLLMQINNIEKSEGTTANWSTKAREFTNMLDNIKGKIESLRKQQANGSTEIVYTKKDIENLLYVQKVMNTISKTEGELRTKLAKAGYTDIKIKGIEDATGKVKELEVTANNAAGALEKINFSRIKVQGGGKTQRIQDWLVQSGDVQVLKSATTAQEELTKSAKTASFNLADLKSKWESQGVLVGEFKTKVEQLESSLTTVGSKGELDKLTSQIKNLKTEASQIADVNKIQLSFDDGTYEAKYDSLIAKTRQWINANDESVISTQRLTTAYNEFNQAATAYAKDGSVANRDKLIQKEEELARQIKATTNEVKSYNAEYAKSSKVDSLHQKIQEFYDKNTATHRKRGAQLKNMLNETAHGAQLTATRVNEIEQEFLGVGNAARQAGKLGDSFFGGIKKQAGQFLQWFSVTSVIMEGVQQVRKMVNEVKTLDNAMMDLTMATGYNKSQIEDLMDTYFKLGDKLSATASDVAASADTWLRQGKSIAETNKLIEDSMVLSKIGGLSSEDSTKYLTSVMKGYKVATEDVIGVVDKLSAVDMASATDVGGLAEGMSEVAASADLAGVSMDKLLGYLATIGEVTQSGMSEVGTTLNAVFARMGNIKLSRLKDYETGEDLSNVETVLRGVGINLRDSMNSFRDFDEVLDETASNWNNYSEVQQRAIAQAFSGTHHMNEFIILMENYDTALKYTETSLGSTGQAMEKFEAYEESIAGHTEKFKNAFQDLSNSVIDSGLINFFIDLGTTGIKAVDGLVDALGGLGAIGAIGGGILGAKNIGKVYECTFSNCFEYALHT